MRPDRSIIAASPIFLKSIFLIYTVPFFLKFFFFLIRK
ncbi:Uncharacterised protein [Segatella copri]|nr:Uncharacterised protein [Segatella copri]